MPLLIFFASLTVVAGGVEKCPYCIEGIDFESYVQKKSSCLEKKSNDYVLKRDHDYYYQAQQ